MRSKLLIVSLLLTVASFGQYQGYWMANNNTDDATGNGLNGTWSSTASYSIGKESMAFNFVSKYVMLPDDSRLKPTTAFTVGVWMKYTGSQYIGMFGNINGIGNGILLSTSSTVAIFRVSTSTVTSITGTTVINDGKWHFIVGTWDGSYIYIYVDGKSDATRVSRSTAPTYLSPSHPAIGAYYQGGTYYSGTCVIDNVFIYSGSMSATQIKNMYNYQKGVYQ